MSENAADESLVEDNSVSIIIFLSSILHYFFFFFLGVVDIETVRSKSKKVGRRVHYNIGEVRVVFQVIQIGLLEFRIRHEF